MAQFHWTPGIGDPSIGGWLTVALYFIASVSCWRTARFIGPADMEGEHVAWRSLSALFLLLAINKQLDLQSALTEIGRLVATYQGWYGQREVVQIAFIALVALACLIAIVILVILIRGAPLPTWIAILGGAMVFTFVLIRAASFHHMDRFIGLSILGLRWNWMIEMGGIIIAILGSVWRAAQGASILAKRGPRSTSIDE